MNKTNKLKKSIKQLEKIDSVNLFDLNKEESKEEKEMFEIIKEFNLKNNKELNSVFEAIYFSNLLKSTKKVIFSIVDDYLDYNDINNLARNKIVSYLIH